MTNCPNCGAVREPAEKRCPYCGTPYPKKSEPPRSVIEPRVPDPEMQKKVQYLLEWKFITPNEARELLGLPPV